jgi:protein-tyrosine kinase
MSRVFEALNKASQEKAKTVTTVAKEAPHPATPPPVVVPPVNGANGKHAAAAAPPPAWSWREKSQEVLFGRDLKNYDAYPIVALEKGSPVAEHYKMLREQVHGLTAATGSYLLSVTSPVKRDGKSTVAVNLSVAMALETDEKVLLIDCDLRNPQLHNYFSLRRSPGITDYLTTGSNASIYSYVQQTSLPGLQVLTAGTATSLSSELLASDRMKNLFNEVRHQFARYRVIVDTPPVLSTPDALVLARQVDGILMIVRAGKTPRDCVTEAMQVLKTDKIVGFVLNGAELGMDSNYYYY